MKTTAMIILLTFGGSVLGAGEYSVRPARQGRRNRRISSRVRSTPKRLSSVRNRRSVSRAPGTEHAIRMVRPKPNVRYTIRRALPNPGVKYTIRVIKPRAGKSTSVTGRGVKFNRD